MDLICLLFLASSFMMLKDYRTRKETYEARKKVHYDSLLEILNEEDTREQARNLMWQEGLSYDRAPEPMSVFVRGLDNRTPTTFFKSGWEEKYSNDDTYRNPILKLYMTPDFAYIVNIILSLLALLFVFDNICGEKEDGTLKLALSYPIPKISMLLGKWIGGFLTLCGPFFVGVLFWMILITQSGEINFGTENVIRFFSIVGISFAYLALFFSLGMFVSAITHTSNTSLLICFFIWVIWIIVIPNAAPVLAKVISPVPGRDQIEKQKEAVDRKTREKIREAERGMLSYLDELEDKKDEIQAMGETEKNEIEDYYRKKVEAQSATAGFIARLSPSGSYVFSTTAIAGTGIDSFKNVFTSYDVFKKDYNQLRDRISAMHWRLPEGWLKQSDIPRLEFSKFRLDDVIDTAMFDVLFIMIYNVLFFMLAFLAFLVYDPK